MPAPDYVENRPDVDTRMMGFPGPAGLGAKVRRGSIFRLQGPLTGTMRSATRADVHCHR
jgi:hypothetical protein